MANYTMTLYDLLDQLSSTHDPHALFPTTYSLYDPTYQAELEGKIFAHFALREIGSEVPDRFLTYFRTAFLETLPKANKLYEVFAHNFMTNLYKNDAGTISRVVTDVRNLTRGIDMTTTRTTETENASTSETTAETESESEDTPYSNYPAGGNYTSGRSKGNSGGTATGSGTASGTENGTSGSDEVTEESKDTEDVQTFSRLTGSEADAAKKYMDILMNVDTLFYQALDDCFMQVW